MWVEFWEKPPYEIFLAHVKELYYLGKKLTFSRPSAESMRKV